MECLHAPWRIEYILAPKPPESDVSLFTRIAQSSDDAELDEHECHDGDEHGAHHRAQAPHT